MAILGLTTGYRLFLSFTKLLEVLHRAPELYGRACLLIDQNRDNNVSVLSIRIDMAALYSELGDMETSIELLKANNLCGINNARIFNADPSYGVCIMKNKKQLTLREQYTSESYKSNHFAFILSRTAMS